MVIWIVELETGNTYSSQDWDFHFSQGLATVFKVDYITHYEVEFEIGEYVIVLPDMDPGEEKVGFYTIDEETKEEKFTEYQLIKT